jgi:hypothetical protein
MRHEMPISMKIALCALAASLGCSSPTAPFTRVPNGDWSDQAAHMAVANSGATIVDACEGDAIAQPLLVDASGNFNWSGTATFFGVGGTVPQPATFTGHADPQQVTIIRTITDASTIPATTHTLTPGSDSAPCTAAVAPIQGAAPSDSRAPRQF